ncbi:hypothetical protein JCM5353_003291 [Sporobolomyces roseus]
MSCLSTPLRFLPVLPTELQLSTVLKSGQSFRWNRSTTLYATLPDHSSDSTSPSIAPQSESEEWSFGWQERTVVLRQDDLGLHYRSLYPYNPPDHTAYYSDLERDTTRQLLMDYFQLSIPLAPLYDNWSKTDDKFRKKLEKEGGRLKGIRVLKQDEWETLVSFICSANNNIPRITLMVNRLCAQLGSPLPHPSHFTPSSIHSPSSRPSLLPSPTPKPNDLSLYSFPPPSSLANNLPKSESILRQLGFGYRANYIPITSSLLLSKPRDYLSSLRKEKGQFKLEEVREKLLEFKGVGRKVADCIMLFGLGWDEIVPVDTHVFQIAIRDYGFPCSSSKSVALTPKLHDSVSKHLSKKWEPYAGWAQQILFFADLKKSSTTNTPSSSPVKGEVNYKVEIKEEEEFREGEGKRRKKSFEEEVREIMEDPNGRKRRRVTQTIVESVKVEVKKEEEVVVIKREVGGEDESSELSEPSSQEDEGSQVKVRRRGKVEKGKVRKRK